MRRIRERFDRKARTEGATWQKAVSDPSVRDPEDGVLALADVRPGSRVLDVGTGRRARHALRAAEAGATCCAVDLSLETLIVAKRALAHVGVGIPLIHADASKLPFGSGTFDIVICAEVLEYWDDYALVDLVRELVRVMCPVGRLVLDAPDSNDDRVWQVQRAERSAGVDFFVRPNEHITQILLGLDLQVCRRQKRDIEIQYLLTR